LNEVKEHLPEIMEDNNLTKAEANALLKEFTKNITFFKVDDIPQKYVDKKDIKFGLATLNSLMA